MMALLWMPPGQAMLLLSTLLTMRDKKRVAYLLRAFQQTTRARAC
jgi:hypothetical protein